MVWVNSISKETGIKQDSSDFDIEVTFQMKGTVNHSIWQVRNKNIVLLTILSLSADALFTVHLQPTGLKSMTTRESCIHQRWVPLASPRATCYHLVVRSINQVWGEAGEGISSSCSRVWREAKSWIINVQKHKMWRGWMASTVFFFFPQTQC